MRRSRSTLHACALAFLLALSGCGSGTPAAAGSDGGPDGPDDAAVSCAPLDAAADAGRRFLDMRITGAGFEAHDGSTVRLYTSGRILDEVFGAGDATIAAGGFTFDFPSGYQRARQQAIYWFVDAERDGVCDTSAGDHVGSLIVGPFDPAQDERIDVGISDNHTPALPSATDPCAGIAAPLHDFDIIGSGFDAHEGLTVHLMTSSPYNGRVLGAGRATISAGAFAFHFPKGFERTTYQDVYWYVDVDGDGTCNTSADHTGYVSTPAFTPLDPSASVQMPITDNHAQTGVHGDVCVVMNGCRPLF